MTSPTPNVKKLSPDVNKLRIVNAVGLIERFLCLLAYLIFISSLSNMYFQDVFIFKGLGIRYMLICNVIYDISRLYAAVFLFIGICKRNRQYLIPIHIVVCIWILFTSYDILGVLFNYFFNDGFSSETWNHDFRLDMTELIMQLFTQLALRSVLSYLSKFYLKLQNRKSSLPVPVTTSTEK